jgi:putative membrane protein
MIGHEEMVWGLGGWWMMIFWIIVVVAVIFFIKWLVERGRTGGETPEKQEDPLDILKKRYARGEIDKDEFGQKKKDLTGP